MEEVELELALMPTYAQLKEGNLPGGKKQEHADRASA